jgi:hypothetical protein
MPLLSTDKEQSLWVQVITPRDGIIDGKYATFVSEYAGLMVEVKGVERRKDGRKYVVIEGLNSELIHVPPKYVELVDE